MRGLLILIVSSTALLFIIALVVYLLGYTELAAAIAAFMLAATHLFAFAAGIGFSHFTQKDALVKGAELVIQSMTHNDKWDVAKSKMAAELFTVGLQHGREQQAQAPLLIEKIEESDWLD